MKNVTAVLITFLRPEYTIECVRSLRENYPRIKILVAENGTYDSELAGKLANYGARYILMPYDSGVCYARNRLVEMAETEFVLVGDDDFYYDPDTGVDKMLSFLKRHDEFILIGGRMREHGDIKDYQGTIDVHPDHLHYHNLDPDDNLFDTKAGIEYQKCDITFNFFLARTDIIRSVKWDEKIKVAYEHSDWFISLMKKHGKNSVAYTPDIIVTHKPSWVTLQKKEEYRDFRHRKDDMRYFFTKHNLEYSIGLRGTKTVFKKDYPPKRYPGLYSATRSLTFNGRSYNQGEIIKTDHPTQHMKPLE